MGNLFSNLHNNGTGLQQFGVIMNIEYHDADALKNACEINKCMLPALKESEAPTVVHLQTSETTAIRLQIFPSAEAFLTVSQKNTNIPRIATLLGYVKSMDCVAFGDVTVDAQAALDKWSALPQVNFTVAKPESSSFCSSELKASPEQFGYMAYVNFKDQGALTKFCAVSRDEDLIAMKKEHLQASVYLKVGELTILSLELFESEAQFLRFNEKAAQHPYMVDPKDGFMSAVKSLDSYAFGKESEALKSALDMWNQAPNLNVMMYPDIAGYSSGYAASASLSQLAVILSYKYKDADAMKNGSRIWKSMHPLFRAGEMCSVVHLQTSEATAEVMQIWPSSEAWLKANKQFAEDPNCATLLSLVESVDVIVVGDTSPEVHAECAKWAPLPQLNLSVRQADSNSFCRSGITASPLQFGYAAHMEFTSQEAIDRLNSVCGPDSDIVALKKKYMQASFQIQMDELRGISFELFESETKFLEFNKELVETIPFMTDPSKEGFGSCIAYSEAQAFGQESETLKTALGMWDQAPNMSVKMYPDTCGYASSCALRMKRPSFGACRVASMEKTPQVHQKF
eukprot:CAMPEP_0197843962 /NCGR_PEP_ID=MMETSP1438-20131217/936_1 /TAXON_ID=1461541 /ORGANISM="Pterosperma sp., Strain CCMP1384" /LENGTH=569 /DNA_ID=CAMNT_0043454463 /DNA_START=133 /DNA_END=1842 /DNA_ORIENTATION=-